MIGLWIFLGGMAVIGLACWYHASRRERRRRGLRAGRLSEADARAVERVFPMWRRVPDEIRRNAEGWVRVFLDEKSFEACGGLREVTREMKLAIASQACLLIACRPQDYYERLRSVLVYPGAYRARHEDGDEDVRLGESWGTGSVVLGWESVLRGGRDFEDGQNVVFHEFAHQIDQEDGAADGVPAFDDAEDYGRWSRAFAPSFESFRKRLESGEECFLDEYGATSPAEFFAVVTETFFELSREMRHEEPEIHEALRRFYGMDPSRW